MSRYIGLDAHASSLTLGVLTPSVERVGSHVVETNARCLMEAVRQIPEPQYICLEEGTLSEWLYEVLSLHAQEVMVAAVSNALSVVLGPPDPHSASNSVRGRALGQEGRRGLQQGAWPWLSVEQRALVKTHLDLTDTLSPQIQQLDDRIQRRSQEHAGASLLQTIPGIGPYRSLLLAGEVLAVSRFPSPDHLVSYAGLAPRTRSSGGKTRYGSTPQAANRWVRGVLVSAMPSHMRSTPDSSLGTYYERQKERIGWQKARVATARKLCQAIYVMLYTGEVWRG